MPDVEPSEPTWLGEVAWLEPCPDALPEGAISVPPGPVARYAQTGSISLAFVTALQLLPPAASRPGSPSEDAIVAEFVRVVLTLTGDRIRAKTRFGNSVLPRFGLPRSLPGR